MLKKIVTALLGIVLLNSCDTLEKQKEETKTEKNVDWHTLSNADSISIKHLDLDISVSFADKKISGIATWSVDNKNSLKFLKLDSYDLSIEKSNCRRERSSI